MCFKINIVTDGETSPFTQKLPKKLKQIIQCFELILCWHDQASYPHDDIFSKTKRKILQNIFILWRTEGIKPHVCTGANIAPNFISTATRNKHFYLKSSRYYPYVINHVQYFTLCVTHILWQPAKCKDFLWRTEKKVIWVKTKW